ncbi:VENN motif pre-toxin domain-containing protein [Laribacter hongkongensis]|uniref:VENN motif pre-toxin domain-containing protein n=1 Tax=Laribacter hongkongensis TaxID=168471 RepID=UPI001EFCCDB3|nr:VENN motif pre-toxin domain-containing protein [Laribacter hongkongensis]MCG9060229.1 VENN motif pre-toxin domain-containing protein [Laribacter hongkongensis]
MAGAAGAGSAPLIAEYLQQTLYPDAHNLTEEQKQSISALTTVVSGLLGGLAGGDSAGVLTGMQAGKNEVENNFLVVPAPPPPIPALQPPVVNTGMDGKPNLGEQISQEIKRSLSGLEQAVTNPEEFAKWVLEGFGVAKPIDPNSYAIGNNEKYAPSPKHQVGGWGTTMDLADKEAQRVLNDGVSVIGKKQIYGVSGGKIYEFQPDNAGG